MAGKRGGEKEWISKKIAGALITGSLVAGVLLPGAAFADQICTITDNGAFSTTSAGLR